MTRRRKQRKGPERSRLGPFLLAFLGGALGILLVLAILRQPSSPPAPPPESVPSRTAHLAALETILTPAAEWESTRVGEPAVWRGRLRGTESLVHWNVRLCAALEAAGLEVTSGEETLIPRRGRWPLQRLTMRVASDGVPLATVIVETSRSSLLPPAF